MTNQVMSDAEITALAHRMASTYTHRTDPTSHAFGFVRHTLIDFSRALLAAERERCAKVCEARLMGDLNREDLEARNCAAAIRQGGDA